MRKDSKNQAKWVNNYNNKKQKCQQVLDIGSVDSTKLTVTQMKAVCSFKKRKSDAAIPSTRIGLVPRFFTTFQRVELPITGWIRENGHDVVIVENDNALMCSSNNEIEVDDEMKVSALL